MIVCQLAYSDASPGGVLEMALVQVPFVPVLQRKNRVVFKVSLVVSESAVEKVRLSLDGKGVWSEAVFG
jgi:hypothetical protein